MNALDRYNTSKCACGKATSVLARPVNARHVEHKGCAVFVGETGEVVGFERVMGDASLIVLPCRNCGKARIARKVLGKVRADKKCDARCMSATGHSCECSCGGKNHGAHHG